LSNKTNQQRHVVLIPSLTIDEVVTSVGLEAAKTIITESISLAADIIVMSMLSIS
jgi:hypothetical protein